MDSMLVTVGFALQTALDKGLDVDVDTTTGRRFTDVRVAATERFCVVLLDAGKAHVVSREHIVSVSMDQVNLLDRRDALEAVS